MKIIFCLLFILSFHIEMQATERQALIGDSIAVFYPPGFNAQEILPSLALVREPGEIGSLPEQWKLHVEFSNVCGKNVACIPVSPHTDLYGTGEVKGNLVRNGTNITLWNTDNVCYGKYHGRRLYQSHPWVLGVRKDGTAFGIIADNTYEQEITLGDEIRFISSGPPFRVIVIERQTPQLIMQALAELTGKMPLPPLWSLGFQQSRWSYYPDTRVKEIADTFRLKNIPCDVIWIDIHYMNDYKVFTFSPKHFPNPGHTNDYLHKHGFKSVWMIDPGVKKENGYFVYDSGNKKDVWVKTQQNDDFVGEVWPGECVFPDFTQPKARNWWANLYKDFMAYEVDGVWNDMNEPSVFNFPGGTMPEDNIHTGGGNLPQGTHGRYHNVYGMLMIKASREGIKKANPDKRPFILTRSNFLGGHRYGATWTGDNAATWKHLKVSIPMSLNLGLSGQPFNGPDIGGFGGNATPELFGHWIALGAFYPFSRAHSMRGTDNQEPWSFGAEIENVSRIAMQRRYRILPYLYTCFRKASLTGVPVMQPTFFADVRDQQLREEQEAFMLGSDLLIIPKWAEQPRLPKGSWHSISLVGEDSENDEYQPDVKIRPGSIVPLCEMIQNTTEYSLDTLTLVIAPDENNEATGWLYHDDGDGYGFRKGDYCYVMFSAKKRNNEIIIDILNKEGKRNLSTKIFNLQLISDEGVTEIKGKKPGELKITINNQ